MLHRSSSDAAIRLRRAKSASSVYHRQVVALRDKEDPATAQQNAQIAAVHAYENAHCLASSMIADPHQPVRSRSSGPRTAEGSHFAARRQSGLRMRATPSSSKLWSTARSLRQNRLSSSDEIKHDDTHAIKAEAPPKPRSSVVAIDCQHEQAEQTRLKNAPPKHRPSQQSLAALSKISVAEKQRMLQDYLLSQRDVTYESPDPSHTLQSIAEYDKSVPHQRTFSSFVGQNALLSKDPEVSGDPDEKIVRKRTSFISNPLSSRRGRTQTHSAVQTTTTITKRTVSANGTHSSTRVLTNSHLPRAQVEEVSRVRAPSLSIKGILKRVFRKPSRPLTPELLPQQQVEAVKPHFADDWDRTPDFTSKASADQSNVQEVLARARSRTPSSSWNRQGTHRSMPAGGQEEALDEPRNCSEQSKSRVTSWADSTFKDTVGSSSTRKRLSVIDEFGLRNVKAGQGLPLLDPAAANDTAFLPSLVRGACDQTMDLQIPLHSIPPEWLNDRNNMPARTPSRQDLKSNDNRAAILKKKSAVEDRPSQQQRKTSFTIRARDVARSTIRAVTPDVRRVSGKRNKVDTDVVCDTGIDDTLVDLLPTGMPSPLKIRQNNSIDVVRPKAMHVSESGRPSRKSWQAARTYSLQSENENPSIAAANTINPHIILRSSVETFCGDVSMAQNPQDASHYLIRQRTRHDTTGAISPSVYSRRTDESPKKAYEDNESSVCHFESRGTAIVLPTYRLSPASSPRKMGRMQVDRSQSSRDWQAWLRKELEDFDRHSDAEVRDQQRPNDDNSSSLHPSLTRSSRVDSAPKNNNDDLFVQKIRPARSGHKRENAQINGGVEDLALRSASTTRTTSASQRSHHHNVLPSCSLISGACTPSEVSKSTASRSTPRITSYEEPTIDVMNERFPMLDTRGTSDRTQERRTSSSAASHQPMLADVRASATQFTSRTVSPRTTRNFSLNKENMPIRHEVPSAVTQSSRQLSVFTANKRQTVMPLKSSETVAGSRTRKPDDLSFTTKSSSVSKQSHQAEHLPSALKTTPASRLPMPPEPVGSTGQTVTKNRAALKSSPPKLSLMPHVVPPSPFTVTTNRASRAAYSTPPLRPASAMGQVEGAGTADSIRRKPLGSSRANLLDSPTLQRIKDGPYGPVHVLPTTADGGKENTPSPSRALRLQNSRGSLNSGGQRMADDFLRRKRMGTVYGGLVVSTPSDKNHGLDNEVESPLTPGFI